MKKKRYKHKRKVMNLYCITNGYTGDGAVHVYVIAENESRAKELATLEFKEDARNDSYERDLESYKRYGFDTSILKEYQYDERYWTNLKVEFVVEDTSQEFVSGVMD